MEISKVENWFWYLISGQRGQSDIDEIITANGWVCQQTHANKDAPSTDDKEKAKSTLNWDYFSSEKS